MIDQPPPLILPDHWAAKRPAIIRPEVDPKQHFPVRIGRAAHRAVQAELQGRADAMLPGMLPVIAGAAPTDPSFANVSLLLHFDGADGSTAFTDSGPLGLAVTGAGNAQIDTAQSKFGGSSLLLDGAGDYITAAGGTQFSFGTDAWTMEFWIRTSQTDATWALMLSKALDTAGQFSFGYNHDGVGSMRWVERLTVRTTATSTGMNDGNWHHVAITRSSNTVRMFLDGTQVGTYTTNYTFGDGTTSLRLGAYGSGLTGEEITGHIDELRITKGVARYTANFARPSAPFPNYT
jgi:hypothetical protein